MPVFSNSNRENIFTYCTDWLINVKDTKLWDHTLEELDSTHPETGICVHYIGDFTTLRIPNFQRGIEWDYVTLKECILSTSPTLGIAVLGRTISIPDVEFMIDGLQRFSAFTYLLQRIDNILFTPATAQNPNPWNLHPKLITRPSLSTIQSIAAKHVGIRGRIQYNHTALRLLRRQAVSQTYSNFCEQIAPQIDALLNPQDKNFKVARSEEFLDALAAFVEKPIFTQELSNFANLSELLATFRGINTIRVELTAADVCRSIIVDGLIGAKATPQDVLDVDNQFNATLLTPTGRIRKGHSSLIKVLESAWTENQNTHNAAILPSLFADPLISTTIKSEFDEFIGWIQQFQNFRSASNYLNFIATIGDNPYVATMLFYFHIHRVNSTLNTPPPDSELHKIAVAYFRRLLDGSVGDTLPITKQVGANQLQGFQNFLQRINPQHAGIIRSAPDTTWLEMALNRIRGRATARIVFNACLLPPIYGDNRQTCGSAFDPITFARGANNWQIDHLIPQNSFVQPLSPGDAYKDTLRNFCPVIGSDNAGYGACDCAQKLNLSTANYVTYKTEHRKMLDGQVHPFINELLNKQGMQGGNPELNNRDWLRNVSASSTPRCYGQERIQILIDLLKDRI